MNSFVFAKTLAFALLRSGCTILAAAEEDDDMEGRMRPVSSNAVQTGSHAASWRREVTWAA